uniref:Uncharacterized protein n=1 Tax=Meloidogyne enterolobii TaxID=390850 RepID=A0A6V7UAI0_MELEN|nr:unnamed protein product [Meloidogyne enterolobii]
MLGWKHRQAYQIMVEFLADPDAVERLRDDERHRCEMNNALNALRAIAAVAPPINEELEETNNNNNILIITSTIIKILFFLFFPIF